MNPSPFKFLDSYTPQDIGSFFGRDRETGELFRQCFVSPILVVYGGSGTGKTSLVQCGLASRFQESDWLPVPVRRSGDMLSSLREEIKAHSLTPSASEDIGELTSNLYLDHFKPVYFLFDQFEELFIFGGRDENEAFFQAINALLGAERNVHVVFIVREEYLAELTRYEHLVPKLIENRYRVERMARSYATDVVERLCIANGIACAEGFSAAMVDRLNPEGQGVELSYLQVYLDRCWRMRKDNEPFSIALLERIGYVDDLLGTFLEEQVAETPDPEHAESLLKTFVSDQGTKRQLTAAEAHDWVNVIGTAMDLDEVERLLQLFVSKRLLRDRDERGRYELLHDALARQIFQRITRAEQELIEVRLFVQQAFGQFEKRGAKLTANDLTYLRPYRNQLHLRGEMAGFVEDAFGEEERKAKRRKLRFRILYGSVFLTFVGIGLLFGEMQKRLEHEQAINESNKLAEKAMEVCKYDPFMAYLIAEEAVKRKETPNAKRALIHTYQFLVPLIARFKGDDIQFGKENGTIFVTHKGTRTVFVYGLDGKLKYEHRFDNVDWDHMNLLAGGRFMLNGKDTPELIDEHGVVRYRFNGPLNEDLIDGDDSSFWVMHRGVLLRWKLGMDGIQEIPFDTVGAGIWLVAPDQVVLDEAMDRLVVAKGGMIYLASVASGSLHVRDSIRIWKEGNRIRPVSTYRGTLYLVPDSMRSDSTTYTLLYQNMVVAIGPQGIWQGAIHENDRLSTITRSSFPKLDVGVGSSYVMRTGKTALVLRTTPNLLYSLLHPGQLIVPNIPDGENVTMYADSLERYVTQEWNGRWRRSKLIVHNMNGRKESEFKTAELLHKQLTVVMEHDPVDGMTVYGMSLVGDTLWCFTSNATGYDYNLKAAGGKWNYLTESLDLNGQRSDLITFLRDGKVGGRFLKPELRGNAVVVLRDSDMVLATAFSDSLFSLISLGKNNVQVGGRPQGWCTDRMVQDSRIVDDSLRWDLLDSTGRSQQGTLCLTGNEQRERHLHELKEGSYPLYGGRYYFLANSWPDGSRGFLVDITHGTYLDTGRFAEPALYWTLKGGKQIVRLAKMRMELMDMELNVLEVLELKDSIQRYNRVDDQLVVFDEVKEGKITVIDAKTMRSTAFRLPLDGFDLDLRNKLKNGEYIGLRGVASRDSVLYISWYDSWRDEGTKCYAVTKSGKMVVHNFDTSVEFEFDEQGNIVAKGSISKFFSFGGNSSVSVSDDGSIRYNLTVEGKFIRVDLEKSRFAMDQRSRPSDPRSLRENGAVILTTDAGQCEICGNHLFTSHRTVDRLEPIPLDTKEILRVVRQEKRFGEFWKGIDPTPLINKALE